MTKIASVSAGPPKPKRVCVIGSSYVGALKKAYSNATTQDCHDYDFSFFASAAGGFQRVTIHNGTLMHINHADDASRDVREYDIAVVYGDFPHPRYVRRIVHEADESLYSEQLRQERLQKWWLGFASFRLVWSLIQTNGPAVYLLSQNTSLNDAILPETEREEAIAIIRDSIGSATYVEVPRDLFSKDGRPREEYYSGSLNVIGNEPDREEQPFHHHTHLNEAGGRLVLAALLDHFRAVVSS